MLATFFEGDVEVEMDITQEEGRDAVATEKARRRVNFTKLVF